METLSVTLVQEASGLDPEANRSRLRSLVPSDSDLVVLPEAFALDFGEAGSDVGPYAEPLDGPFAIELGSVAAAHGTTAVAGTWAAHPAGVGPVDPSAPCTARTSSPTERADSPPS